MADTALELGQARSAIEKPALRIVRRRDLESGLGSGRARRMLSRVHARSVKYAWEHPHLTLPFRPRAPYRSRARPRRVAAPGQSAAASSGLRLAWTFLPVRRAAVILARVLAA